MLSKATGLKFRANRHLGVQLIKARHPKHKFDDPHNCATRLLKLIQFPDFVCSGSYTTNTQTWIVSLEF